jgi:hypothetical protein
MQTFTIYKYRDWTNPLHVEMLKSNKIYLPSPEELNDPFDCRIPIDLELLDTDTKILSYFSKYINVNLNSTAIVNEFKSNKSQYIKTYKEIYKKKGDLHFGIFCASMIWDSIQMWTYYSDNHSGFCIGFDPEKLLKYIPGYRAMKVIYQRDYPKIQPLITYDSSKPSKEFIENCFKSSHTKAIGWKYEKEYRIFSNKFPIGYTKEERLIQIDDQCIKSLFVGLNFPEIDLPIIVDFANELRIPVYKIRQIHDKFRLGKTKIN